jgi:Polyketide cyclase / dehydrase and lipid transport
MKQLLALIFSASLSIALAQDVQSPFDLQLAVSRNGDRFQVSASYDVPMNVCEAFAFITDYEGANDLPGILESKVLSRSGNKVKVARLLQEQILFIPFEMRSELEYTEIPNRVLHFEQVSGDTKYYKGSWRLFPGKGGTTFKYDGQVEPNSLVPASVIEYFIKTIIRRQFEAMAELATQRKSSAKIACK